MLPGTVWTAWPRRRQCGLESFDRDQDIAKRPQSGHGATSDKQESIRLDLGPRPEKFSVGYVHNYPALVIGKLTLIRLRLGPRPEKFFVGWCLPLPAFLARLVRTTPLRPFPTAAWSGGHGRGW